MVSLEHQAIIQEALPSDPVPPQAPWAEGITVGKVAGEPAGKPRGESVRRTLRFCRRVIASTAENGTPLQKEFLGCSWALVDETLGHGAGRDPESL